jgi:hypothetical protein
MTLAASARIFLDAVAKAAKSGRIKPAPIAA